jgi:Asp/Glu/hydantoin racemase
VRVLVINPNTSPSVTDRVAAATRAVVGDRAEVIAVTGRFGARYISARAAAAIAGHAALEALAAHVEGCDAVYLACFGDPGLAALKEVSPVPVVGMAEASCEAACRRGAPWACQATCGRTHRRADRRRDRPASRCGACAHRRRLHGLRQGGRR